MNYYIFVEDNERINGCGQCRVLNDNITNVEVSEEVYNKFIEDNLLYVWDGDKLIDNPNYEEDNQRRQNQIRIEDIKYELEELDRKRIRAICEPSDKEPGLSWLEFYNQQIAELREELDNLQS
jgi:hypothetical protein